MRRFTAERLNSASIFFPFRRISTLAYTADLVGMNFHNEALYQKLPGWISEVNKIAAWRADGMIMQPTVNTL